MKREEIIKIIHELKDEIKLKYKAEVKGIFGSFARGEEREDSDLDVLVSFERGATILDLVDLSDFLEEKTGRKLDVVSERALREEIKDEVMKDLVPV